MSEGVEKNGCANTVHADVAHSALDAGMVARLQDWLGALWSTPEAQVAWLTAPAGSGLTHLVRCLTRDWESVWFNTACTCSRAFLKDVCSNPRAVNGKQKILILDELDVVLSNENTMVDINFLFKHAARIPIICVLKSTRVAVGCDLAKKCALVLHFPVPATHDMLRCISHAVAPTTVDLDRAATLCLKTPGDVRHVIRALQASATHTRDVTMSTQAAVSTLLTATTTVQDALALFWGDTCFVPHSLFECYWQAAGDIRQCTAYADMASAADVVDERIHAKARWDLLEFYGCLTTASAALALPKAPVEITKFGTLWNKNYMHCARIKTFKNINSDRVKLAGHPLAWLDAVDLAFIRRMVHPMPHDHIAAFCAGNHIGALGLLHIMRLWNSDYKLSKHNRVRALLAAPAAAK